MVMVIFGALPRTPTKSGMIAMMSKFAQMLATKKSVRNVKSLIDLVWIIEEPRLSPKVGSLASHGHRHHMVMPSLLKLLLIQQEALAEVLAKLTKTQMGRLITCGVILLIHPPRGRTVT